MKKRKVLPILILSCLLFFTSSGEACRFWVANAENISPALVTDHLLDFPQSLKMLGNEYSDGWSVSFYVGTTAIVARSEKPSHLDQKYDEAIQMVTNSKANTVIGHLRRASSGCIDGVPNPHPFQKFQGVKNWLFGHNGGIDKELLMELIGEEYLNANPPATCMDNPPDSWVDSELYFIYLLKHLDHSTHTVIGNDFPIFDYGRVTAHLLDLF